ncbi:MULTISPECIES: hypothetical protein [Bacillus cereus group]|uniref:hypothetical protein n=1 Tax=Bacillus cereus group TaxID=86661 RepID=UPI0002790104|nr:hypothetical protein [Bacillus paranthracis]EJQ03984.1 hypothetical protein IC5_02782 [Bacillus cereus AND1407]KMP88650.1 hypothetical protein TU64_04000 [Bacillus cereus]KMQ12672.1 hypothetical protein TU69_25930 [Bacillus cereus]MCC2359001.1 hypothetical protein [Bacillus paranthracis]MCU5367711.1 hypothetical protein [Bacillus paranthracis]
MKKYLMAFTVLFLTVGLIGCNNSVNQEHESAQDEQQVKTRSTSTLPDDVIKFTNAYCSITDNPTLSGNPIRLPEQLNIVQEKKSTNEIMYKIYFLNNQVKDDFRNSSRFNILLNDKKNGIQQIVYSGPMDLNTFYVSLGALDLLKNPLIDEFSNQIDFYLNKQDLTPFDEHIQSRGWDINVQFNISPSIPPMSFILEKI